MGHNIWVTSESLLFKTSVSYNFPLILRERERNPDKDRLDKDES